MAESTTLIVTMDQTTLEIACVGTTFGTCTTTSASQCRSIGTAFGSSAWGSARAASVKIRRGTSFMGADTKFITFRASAAGLMDTTEFAEGIYVDAPRGVLIKGADTVVFKVYANVGRYTLFQWGISMDFDPSALTFVSLTTPDTTVFTSPFVTAQPTRISANTEARSGALTAPREGSAVHIATVTFSIAGAPGTVYPTAVSNMQALFLVNINNNQFVTNSRARVYDFAGKNSVGSVAVSVSPDPVTIGIRSYTSTPYVITKPDGTSTSTSITTDQIQSVFGSSTIPSSGTTCTTTDTNALSITSCSVVKAANPALAVSTPGAAVSVSYLGLFVARVQIRAYVPTTMRVAVDGDVNNILVGETRRVRTFVRWGGDASGTSDEVEVTGTQYSVPLNFFNTLSIVFLRDGLIRGKAAGAVQIAAVTPIPAYALVPPVSVTVVVATSAGKVQLVYYAGIQWSARTLPVLQATPKLTKEGDTHTVMAVLENTGGSSGSLMQMLNVASSHPATYAITVPSVTGMTSGGLENGYAWMGYIPVDAVKVACTNLTVSGNATASGLSVMPRNLDLPLPDITSFTMCCSGAQRLSPAGDILLLTGYTATSYSGLYSTVGYGDGTTVSVTNDVRVTYEIMTNTCGASTDGRSRVTSVASNGTFIIRARFRGLTTNNVQLDCVTATGIEPYMVRFGSSIRTTTLNRVNCATRIFQSGRVQSSVRASNNALVDIQQSLLSFSTGQAAILRKSFGNNGFTGVSVGSTTITASITPFSASMTVSVATQSSVIISMVVSPFPLDTFVGVHGAETVLGVQITMADGSIIPNIFGGGWPDYLVSDLAPTLVRTSTNDASEVNVSLTRGTAILMDNSHQPVTIVVRPTELVCEAQNLTNVIKAIPVSGNLDLATEGDVDIGYATGLPIRVMSSPLGSPVTSAPVDVRLRVQSAALKAFDIALVFNTAIARVHSCTIGTGWAGAFTCTVNNVEGYVQVCSCHVTHINLNLCH